MAATTPDTTDSVSSSPLARSAAVEAIKEYVQWEQHMQRDVQGLSKSIDKLWLDQAKLSCVVELCDEVLDRDFARDCLKTCSKPAASGTDATATDDVSEVDGAKPSLGHGTAECEKIIHGILEDLALNCLHATFNCRSGVALDGGLRHLEETLTQFCSEKACELAPYIEKLADPEAPAFHAAEEHIKEVRSDCENEFVAILKAKTANAEMMSDFQEIHLDLRRKAWDALQDILCRMAAHGKDADEQGTGCLWLGALSAYGPADRSQVISMGGVQALLRAVRLHHGDATVQLLCCRALCMLALDGTANQKELVALSSRIESLRSAERRLRDEDTLVVLVLQAVADIASGADADKVTSQIRAEMDAVSMRLRKQVTGKLTRQSRTFSAALDRGDESFVRQISPSCSSSSPSMLARLAAEKSSSDDGKAYAEVRGAAERRLREILEEKQPIVDEKSRNAKALYDLGLSLASDVGVTVEPAAETAEAAAAAASAPAKDNADHASEAHAAQANEADSETVRVGDGSQSSGGGGGRGYGAQKPGKPARLPTISILEEEELDTASCQELDKPSSADGGFLSAPISSTVARGFRLFDFARLRMRVQSADISGLEHASATTAG